MVRNREVYRFDNALGLHSRHDNGGLVHSFRPLMSLPDHHSGKSQGGSFFCQRATVGEHASSVHLQLDVVREAQRLEKLDSRAAARTLDGSEARASAGVGRDDDFFLEAPGYRFQGSEKAAEIAHIVDVFLTV